MGAPAAAAWEPPQKVVSSTDVFFIGDSEVDYGDFSAYFDFEAVWGWIINEASDQGLRECWIIVQASDQGLHDHVDFRRQGTGSRQHVSYQGLYDYTDFRRQCADSHQVAYQGLYEHVNLRRQCTASYSQVSYPGPL
eukprot:UN4949